MAKDSIEHSEPTCSNCKFCKSGVRPDKSMFLKCCLLPPVVAPIVMVEPVFQAGVATGVEKKMMAPTGWPEVLAEWWCGKHERQMH